MQRATIAPYDALLPTPSRDRINAGLSPLPLRLVSMVLGLPRGDVPRDCQPVTNESLRRRIVTEDVGPFRVTGYDLAVRSLREVFSDVRGAAPDLYRQVRTAGMLCVRAVRGTRGVFSNHSWGMAIDVYFGSRVDVMGDGKTQRGLILLAPFFHRHGWYWGAGFSREDSMHWEVSQELFQRWRRAGFLS